MKRVLVFLVLVVPVAFLINTAFTAMEKEMSIQVDRAQLRSTPAYFGSVVTAVNYADRLKIIDSKGAWVKYANIDFGSGVASTAEFGLEPSGGDKSFAELRLDAPNGQLVGTLMAGQKSCRCKRSPAFTTCLWSSLRPRIACWTGSGFNEHHLKHHRKGRTL
jgi:hypothetical protein